MIQRAGSVKKGARPEITVLSARPMNDVNFDKSQPQTNQPFKKDQPTSLQQVIGIDIPPPPKTAPPPKPARKQRPASEIYNGFSSLKSVKTAKVDVEGMKNDASSLGRSKSLFSTKKSTSRDNLVRPAPPVPSHSSKDKSGHPYVTVDQVQPAPPKPLTSFNKKAPVERPNEDQPTKKVATSKKKRSYSASHFNEKHKKEGGLRRSASTLPRGRHIRGASPVTTDYSNEIIVLGRRNSLDETSKNDLKLETFAVKVSRSTDDFKNTLSNVSSNLSSPIRENSDISTFGSATADEGSIVSNLDSSAIAVSSPAGVQEPVTLQDAINSSAVLAKLKQQNELLKEEDASHSARSKSPLLASSDNSNTSYTHTTNTSSSPQTKSPEAAGQPRALSEQNNNKRHSSATLDLVNTSEKCQNHVTSTDRPDWAVDPIASYVVNSSSLVKPDLRMHDSISNNRNSVPVTSAKRESPKKPTPPSIKPKPKHPKAPSIGKVRPWQSVDSAGVEVSPGTEELVSNLEYKQKLGEESSSMVIQAGSIRAKKSFEEQKYEELDTSTPVLVSSEQFSGQTSFDDKINKNAPLVIKAGAFSARKTTLEQNCLSQADQTLPDILVGAVKSEKVGRRNTLTDDREMPLSIQASSFSTRHDSHDSNIDKLKQQTGVSAELQGFSDTVARASSIIEQPRGEKTENYSLASEAKRSNKTVKRNELDHQSSLSDKEIHSIDLRSVEPLSDPQTLNRCTELESKLVGHSIDNSITTGRTEQKAVQSGASNFVDYHEQKSKLASNSHSAGLQQQKLDKSNFVFDSKTCEDIMKPPLDQIAQQTNCKILGLARSSEDRKKSESEPESTGSVDSLTSISSQITVIMNPNTALQSPDNDSKPTGVPYDSQEVALRKKSVPEPYSSHKERRPKPGKPPPITTTVKSKNRKSRAMVGRRIQSSPPSTPPPPPKLSADDSRASNKKTARPPVPPRAPSMLIQHDMRSFDALVSPDDSFVRNKSIIAKSSPPSRPARAPLMKANTVHECNNVSPCEDSKVVFKDSNANASLDDPHNESVISRVSRKVEMFNKSVGKPQRPPMLWKQRSLDSKQDPANRQADAVTTQSDVASTEQVRREGQEALEIVSKLKMRDNSSVVRRSGKGTTPKKPKRPLSFSLENFLVDNISESSAADTSTNEIKGIEHKKAAPSKPHRSFSPVMRTSADDGRFEYTFHKSEGAKEINNSGSSPCSNSIIKEMPESPTKTIPKVVPQKPVRTSSLRKNNPVVVQKRAEVVESTISELPRSETQNDGQRIRDIHGKNDGFVGNIADENPKLEAGSPKMDDSVSIQAKTPPDLLHSQIEKLDEIIMQTSSVLNGKLVDSGRNDDIVIQHSFQSKNQSGVKSEKIEDFAEQSVSCCASGDSTRNKIKNAEQGTVLTEESTADQMQDKHITEDKVDEMSKQDSVANVICNLREEICLDDCDQVAYKEDSPSGNADMKTCPSDELLTVENMDEEEHELISKIDNILQGKNIDKNHKVAENSSSEKNHIEVATITKEELPTNDKDCKENAKVEDVKIDKITKPDEITPPTVGNELKAETIRSEILSNEEVHKSRKDTKPNSSCKIVDSSRKTDFKASTINDLSLKACHCDKGFLEADTDDTFSNSDDKSLIDNPTNSPSIHYSDENTTKKAPSSVQGNVKNQEAIEDSSQSDSNVFAEAPTTNTIKRRPPAKPSRPVSFPKVHGGDNLTKVQDRRIVDGNRAPPRPASLPLTENKIRSSQEDVSDHSGISTENPNSPLSSPKINENCDQPLSHNSAEVAQKQSPVKATRPAIPAILREVITPQSITQSSGDGACSKKNYEIAEPHCIALFDYIGESPEDLEFKVGDLIILEKRVSGEWFYGSYGGVKGIFPAKYVEVIVDFPSNALVVKEPLIDGIKIAKSDASVPGKENAPPTTGETLKARASNDYQVHEDMN